MKKITKTDLVGLTKLFPVYDEEYMRKVLGGATIDEIMRTLMANFGTQGYSFYDNLGDFSWFSSYDSFINCYSSFQNTGYVDRSHPGFFYLNDGDGGFTTHYAVYGGGSSTIPPSWDCTFNAFIELVRRMDGTSYDKEKMVHAFNMFHDAEVESDGSVNITEFLKFIKRYGYVGNRTSEIDTDKNQLMMFRTTDGIFHVVRPTEIKKEINGNGTIRTKINYYDATTGTNGSVYYDTIKHVGIYNISSGSSSGDGSYK